jgi:formyl-CoA transferase
VKSVERIDAAIAEWTSTQTLENVLAALNEARIPAGKIYDVADIADDPHYRARDMILETQLPDGTPVKVPGVVPKLSATPGTVDTLAPTLGEHTDTVLGRIGIDTQTRDAWRARGII